MGGHQNSLILKEVLDKAPIVTVLVLAAECLAISVRSNAIIKGIKVNGKSQTIEQFTVKLTKMFTRYQDLN